MPNETGWDYKMNKPKLMSDVFDLQLQSTDIKIKMEKVKEYLNKKYWEYKEDAKNLRKKHIQRTKLNRKLYTGYEKQYTQIENKKQELILNNRGII